MMRYIKLLALYVFCSFAMTDQLYSQEKGYQNQILEIYELTTGSGTKFILNCEYDDPICNYAPESYTESQDDMIHRFFMPMTTMALGLAPSFELYECDQGVELVIEGSSIQKIISGNKIVITTDKNN